jgi:hypothetical protein
MWSLTCLVEMKCIKVKCFGEQTKPSVECLLVKDVIFLVVDWFFKLAKFESVKLTFR